MNTIQDNVTLGVVDDPNRKWVLERWLLCNGTTNDKLLKEENPDFVLELPKYRRQSSSENAREGSLATEYGNGSVLSVSTESSGNDNFNPDELKEVGDDQKEKAEPSKAPEKEKDEQDWREFGEEIMPEIVKFLEESARLAEKKEKVKEGRGHGRTRMVGRGQGCSWFNEGW